MTNRPIGRLGGRQLCVSLGAVIVLVVAACAPVTVRHGHQFRDTDLQQIQPGMSQEAVRAALGTPVTTSSHTNGSAFYYISSTSRQMAFMKPSEIDRKVVAVYFNPTGSVESVAHYGLQDGKVVNFNRRETPSHARDQGLIAQILRGIGPSRPFE